MTEQDNEERQRRLISDPRFAVVCAGLAATFALLFGATAIVGGPLAALAVAPILGLLLIRRFSSEIVTTGRRVMDLSMPSVRHVGTIALICLMVTSSSVVFITFGTQPAAAQSVSEEWNTSSAGASSVAAANDGRVWVSGDDVLQKYDSDGNQQYNVSIGGSITRGLYYSESEDLLYAGDNAGTVYKIDPSDGSILDQNSVMGLVWDIIQHPETGELYVAGESGSSATLASVSSSDLSTNWKKSPSSGSWFRQATYSETNDMVYATGQSGTPYEFNPDTGSSTSLGSVADTTSGIGSLNGTLYVADWSGNITKVLSDGSVDDQVSVNSDILEELRIDENTETITVSSGNSPEVASYSPDLTQEWSTNPFSSTYDTFIGLSQPPGGNLTVFAGDANNGLAKLVTDGSIPKDTESIRGQVLTEDGNPVTNSTVQITGVNYDNIQPSSSQTLEDRANELLDEAENPLPPTFDRNLDVRKNYLKDSSEQVALAYTREDVATAPWTDSADLVPPRTVLPADEPVVLAPWNPDGSNGLLANEYQGQLPGAPSEKGPVIVEQMGPDGSVVQTQKVEVDKTAGGGFGDPSSMPYGEVRLSPGIYQISLEGNDAKYLISVGNPDAIAGALEGDLETEADQLTQRAKAIRDRFSNNKFESTTVETNETGHYTAEVSSNVNTIAVEGYKAPDVPIDAASDTHPRTQIRNYVETYDYNGSVYLPSQPKRYGVPSSNADVTLREVSHTPYENVSGLQDRLENLRNLVENQSQRLESVLQQPNASREELESTYNALNNVSQNNDQLRQRASDLLGEDRSLTVDPDNATDAELRERVVVLEQALQEQRDTLPSDGTESSTNEETVNSVARFAGDLSKDQVSVIAHYSNGTSKPVSDEYLTLDQSAGTIAGIGTTAVHVEEYPVGDAASIEFEWIAASADGVGRATDRVTNPLVNSEAPDIDSVRVSSLAPGPSDTVSVEINPASDSDFRKLTSATVFGPDGVTIPTTNISEGRETSFQTNGQGTHTLKLTYENTEGTQFTKTVRLGADSKDRPRPASIRAESGPTGVFALVGDGLNDGDVTVSENGDISVSAVVQDTEDPPAEIHAYTGTVDTDPSGDISTRLVGPDGAALSHRAWVNIHAKSTSEDGTYVYRNGNEPVTSDGNQYGTVTHQNNQTLIRTYTNANGEASVTVKQPSGIIDPTVEAVRWRYYQLSSGFNVPILSSLTLVGIGLFTRRRRNRGASP